MYRILCKHSTRSCRNRATVYCVPVILFKKGSSIRNCKLDISSNQFHQICISNLYQCIYASGFHTGFFGREGAMCLLSSSPFLTGSSVHVGRMQVIVEPKRSHRAMGFAHCYIVSRGSESMLLSLPLSEIIDALRCNLEHLFDLQCRVSSEGGGGGSSSPNSLVSPPLKRRLILHHVHNSYLQKLARFDLRALIFQKFPGGHASRPPHGANSLTRQYSHPPNFFLDETLQCLIFSLKFTCTCVGAQRCIAS